MSSCLSRGRCSCSALRWQGFWSEDGACLASSCNWRLIQINAGGFENVKGSITFVDQASGLYSNPNGVQIHGCWRDYSYLRSIFWIACPPTLKIFEGEVNQGLRDYQ